MSIILKTQLLQMSSAQNSLEQFQTYFTMRITIILETMKTMRQMDCVVLFTYLLLLVEVLGFTTALMELYRREKIQRIIRENKLVVFVSRSNEVSGVSTGGNQQLTPIFLGNILKMVHVCPYENYMVKGKRKYRCNWSVLIKSKVCATNDLVYSTRTNKHAVRKGKRRLLKHKNIIHCSSCGCLLSNVDSYCKSYKLLLKTPFLGIKFVKKLLKKQRLQLIKLCRQCNNDLFYKVKKCRCFKSKRLMDLFSFDCLQVRQNIELYPLEGHSNSPSPLHSNFGENSNADDIPHLSRNQPNQNSFTRNTNHAQLQQHEEAMDYTENAGVGHNAQFDFPPFRLQSNRPDCPTPQRLGFAQNAPRETMYEDFNTRVTSFVHWPARYTQTPMSLASSGLYFTGSGDLVRCYFCGVGLRDWKVDEDPNEEHFKASPDCGYLTQKLGHNTIQQFKRRIQPCTDNGENTVPDFAASSIGVSNLFHLQNNQPTLYPGDYARSPEYAAFDVRLSTYTKWPVDLPQRPPKLTEAGFYYTGVRDVVRCYVCDGGLQKWDPSDDPWVEHARWFPTCPYVLRVKGEDFVQLVGTSYEEPEEEVEAVVPNFQRWSSPSSASKQSEKATFKGDSKESNGVWPVSALSVLEMGYSKKAVQMALTEVQKSSKSEPSAQAILSLLMDKEDAGEKLPTDSPLSSSPIQTGEDSERHKDVIAATAESSLSDQQKLLAEHETLINRIKCSDCHEKDKNVLFLPCTHFELCEGCAADVFVCPQCWREVKQKVKTYMS